MRRISLRLILSAIGLCVGCILLGFVISNQNNTTHEEKPQSVKCDCPSAEAAVTKIIPSVLNVTANVERPIPCIEIQKDSPVQRAIVIYYPHHQSEYFFPEVRW
jgi:hypothetical protein